MRQSAAAVVATLAAVGTLAGCSGHGDSAPKTATAVVLPKVTLSEGKVSLTNAPVAIPTGAKPVITPNGSTTVAVGHAATSSVSGKSNLMAAPGMTLVPVSWSFQPSGSSVDPGKRKTSLIISAGKQSWLVSDDVSAGGKIVISVPSKDLSSLTPKVVFDNLAQSVDAKTASVVKATNGAAAYYDGHKTDGGRSSCAPINQGGSGAGMAFSATCGLVSIDRSPWLPDRGWAAPGKQWVTMQTILVPGQMTFTNASGKKVNYPQITSSVPFAVVSGIPASSITKKASQNTIVAQTPVSSSFSTTITEAYTGRASGTIPADVPVQQTVTVDVAANVVFDKP